MAPPQGRTPSAVHMPTSRNQRCKHRTAARGAFPRRPRPPGIVNAAEAQGCPTVHLGAAHADEKGLGGVAKQLAEGAMPFASRGPSC